MTVAIAALLSAPRTLVPSLKIVSDPNDLCLGMLAHAEPDIVVLVEAEIVSVQAEDLRLHVRREADIDRIDVSDEANARCARHGSTLHRRHRRAVVEFDVVEPHCRQFLGESNT